MVNETPLVPDLERLEEMIAEETSIGPPEGRRPRGAAFRRSRRRVCERLRQTARRLCSSLEALHPQSLAYHPTYIRCVDETLARAWQQVSGPALAATQKSPR